MKILNYFLCIVAISVLARCGNDDEVNAPKGGNLNGSVSLQQDAGILAAKKPSTGFPSYNTSPLPPDATGMTSNAVQLAAKINLGWNIGNSLEAIGSETAWGNPMVTKELIDKVKL